MAELLSLRVTIKDDASGKIKRLRAEVENLDKAADKTSKKQVRGARDAGRQYRVLGVEVGGLTQKIEKASKSVTGLIGGFLKVGAVAGGAAGGAALAYGYKIASSFEQARISFEAFLGSAQAGNTFFEQLQQINLESPFELQDVTQVGRTFLMAGYSAEEAAQATKNFLDLAAGAGATSADLQRIAYNFQQISALGRVTGAELRDLARAGIPIQKILAESLGRSTESMRNMRDEAVITAEEFKRALIAPSGETWEIWGGMAGKQMLTVQGQMSNFMDKIQIAFDEVMQPLLAEVPDVLTDLGEVVQTLISGVIPPMVRMGNVLSGVMGTLATAATPAIVAALEGMESLLEVFAENPEEFGQFFSDLTVSMEQFFTALGPIVPVLKDFMLALLPILPEFLTNLTMMMPLLVPLLEVVNRLLSMEITQVVAGWALAFLVFARVLKVPLSALKGIWNWAKRIFGKDGVADKAGKAGEGAGKGAGKGGFFRNLFRNPFKALLSPFGILLSALTGFIAELGLGSGTMTPEMKQGSAEAGVRARPNVAPGWQINPTTGRVEPVSGGGSDDALSRAARGSNPGATSSAPVVNNNTNVRVVVNNPSSNVQVERAVTEAIRKHNRERLERY